MAEERKPVSKKLWAFVTVSFGLLLLVILIISLPSSDDTPKPEHSAVSAWTVCQQFLEGRLKSPASAKYPSGYSNYTTHLGAGQYRVTAYVDSQNSFGAMIRNDFICTVQHTEGDSYSLVSLDFPK